MSKPVHYEPGQVRQARFSISGLFLIFGLTAGLWFVHIPVVSGRLALEPAMLGVLLLCFGIGSLIFQPIAGILLARIGSKSATVAAIFSLLVLLAMATNAANWWMLAITLFFSGAAGGSMNVAANTQASKIEEAHGRPTMSIFHGFFSLGVLTAAVVGGTIINMGWGNGGGAIIAYGIMLPIAAFAGTGLIKEQCTPEATKAAGRRFVLPAGALLVLAGLAFMANTIEFTVNDWSALYLTTDKGISAGDAAAGLALFSLAMTLSRFAGGAVVGWLGAKKVVVAGGAIAALGMLVVLLAESVILSTSGFLLVGIGASNLAPLLMSQASHIPGVAPSIGVAATSTGLTAGFLLSPPIIGFVAQATSLSIALCTTVIFGVLISVGAWRRSWQRATT